MAALNVDLAFYRNATTESMHIDTDADGNLRDDSNLGGTGHPITGTYDQATSALTFSAGGLGGIRGGDLFVSHYSGYAIFDNDGNLFGLAGTYHELVITVEPFGFAEALGGWYAIPSME